MGLQQNTPTWNKVLCKSENKQGSNLLAIETLNDFYLVEISCFKTVWSLYKEQATEMTTYSMTANRNVTGNNSVVLVVLSYVKYAMAAYTSVGTPKKLALKKTHFSWNESVQIQNVPFWIRRSFLQCFCSSEILMGGLVCTACLRSSHRLLARCAFIKMCFL